MKRKLMFLMTFLFIGIGLMTAQTSRVTGLVTSEEDGQPVVGAAILIEGTKSGSITDVDGRFVLSASKGDKLVVSYIGMKTAKVKAEPKVTVTLKDE